MTVATHGNVPFSPEGDLLTRWFFETHLDLGLAEILDPYEALGTPQLDP